MGKEKMRVGGRSAEWLQKRDVSGKRKRRFQLAIGKGSLHRKSVALLYKSPAIFNRNPPLVKTSLAIPLDFPTLANTIA